MRLKNEIVRERDRNLEIDIELYSTIDKEILYISKNQYI